MENKKLEDYRKDVIKEYPNAVLRKLPQGNFYSIQSNNDLLKSERLSKNPFEGKTAVSELEAWKQASEKVLERSKNLDINNNGIKDIIEKLSKYPYLDKDIDITPLKKYNNDDVLKIIEAKLNSLNVNKISDLDIKHSLEVVKEKILQKNSFTINEIPINDLQKLGIKKEDLLKNNSNIDKLLSGNKTSSITINKFDALDIKVRLELVKNAQNEVQLIVTPDKMELKNDYQKTIDSLLKNKGVLENSTDKINNLKETIYNHNDIKFLNEPNVEKSFNDLKEKYPNAKEKDITPDTWLKVDSNIAQLYKEKYNLPVIKVKDEHHIGFKLKDIDKYSLKQNKDVLKQVSNSLNQRKTTLSR